MNNLLIQTTNLQNSEILILDVIEDFVTLKKSAHTERSYRADIRAFFKWLEITFLDELALFPYPTIVDKLKLFLEHHSKRDPHTNRVQNPKTVNRKAYALSAFFHYLIDVYSYPKNPIKWFSPLKTDRKSTTTSLTRAEIIDLLAFAKGKHRQGHTQFRDYLILVFMFSLALRRDEVANLKRDDVNFQNYSLNVYQKGWTYKLLPLPLAIVGLISSFKQTYPSECPYIFHPTRNNRTQELNKPIRTEYIFEMVKDLAFQVIPEKHITPHSLRKTFIELALNNKEDFISIINATGHSTVEMINYYV